jgi:hypothetical protein
MKRCPTCNRTYEEEARISFCLEDGAVLSPSYREPTTQRFSNTPDTDPTPVVPKTASSKAVLPPTIPAYQPRHAVSRGVLTETPSKVGPSRIKKYLRQALRGSLISAILCASLAVIVLICMLFLGKLIKEPIIIFIFVPIEFGVFGAIVGLPIGILIPAIGRFFRWVRTE